MEALVARLAVALVVTYRRWLSPLRRKRCARGVLLGGENSCSTVALSALQEHPLSVAITRVRDQFEGCRTAAFSLSGAESEAAPQVIRTEDKTAACCEMDLHLQAVRDLIIQAFLILCVVKYLLALGYHYGGEDDWVRWLYESVYGWIAASFIGAAGSQLWPIVLLAALIDAFALRALMRRENASTFIILAWALSVFVLYFDDAIRSTLDMNYLSMAWDYAALGEDLSGETSGWLLTKVPVDVFGLWLPSKVLVTLLWAAAGALLLMVNELSRRRTS